MNYKYTLNWNFLFLNVSLATAHIEVRIVFLVLSWSGFFLR